MALGMDLGKFLDRGVIFKHKNLNLIATDRGREDERINRKSNIPGVYIAAKRDKYTGNKWGIYPREIPVGRFKNVSVSLYNRDGAMRFLRDLPYSILYLGVGHRDGSMRRRSYLPRIFRGVSESPVCER